MERCHGACGREGAGPFDSGRPEEDRRHTWCDPCYLDLAAKRMPPGLVKYCPPGSYVPFAASPPSGPQLNAMTRTKHKIVTGTEVKSVATITAGPVTAAGSFSGYIASFAKDHEGDTIMGAGAVADTVAAVNNGSITWLLTDSHSEKASDVVATVTSAAVDSHGVRIQGVWAPTETAQRLRQMAGHGHRLGLSIDYIADRQRPDPSGGRFLDSLRIFGGAVVTHPMNAGAYITASKSGAWAPVVDVYEHAYAESQRHDPARLADDRLLAAASWPPPGLFDRKTSLALIRGAAAAKAARIPARDDGSQARRARYEQQNRYSTALHEWMAEHR